MTMTRSKLNRWQHRAEAINDNAAALLADVEREIADPTVPSSVDTDDRLDLKVLAGLLRPIARNARTITVGVPTEASPLAAIRKRAQA